MNDWLEFKDSGSPGNLVSVRVRDVVAVRDMRLDHVPSYANQTMIHLNGGAAFCVAEDYKTVLAKIKTVAERT